MIDASASVEPTLVTKLFVTEFTLPLILSARVVFALKSQCHLKVASLVYLQFLQRRLHLPSGIFVYHFGTSQPVPSHCLPDNHMQISPHLQVEHNLYTIGVCTDKWIRCRTQVNRRPIAPTVIICFII